jgi:hypothetical protein
MTLELGKFIPWFPVKETVGYYQITYFTHTFEGLVIYLSKQDSDRDTKLRVTFPGSKVICRIMNETYRGKLSSYFHEHYKDIGACGPLFKVEDSEYMRSLSEESDTLTYELDFEHYFIEDSEWTFDVASQNQPQIDLFIEGVLVEKLEAQCHRTIKKNKM